MWVFAAGRADQKKLQKRLTPICFTAKMERMLPPTSVAPGWNHKQDGQKIKQKKSAKWD
jgi:hypothetical protein